VVFDVRRPGGAPLLTIQAHGKAVTSLDWNPTLPDCLLTLSADRSLRLWHVPSTAATGAAPGGAEPEPHGGVPHYSLGTPQMVAERSVAGTAGKLFTGSFSPDRPHLAVIAGSKGLPVVINLLQDEAIIAAWPAPLV
jgi:WD40 repeat protein